VYKKYKYKNMVYGKEEPCCSSSTNSNYNSPFFNNIDVTNPTGVLLTCAECNDGKVFKRKSNLITHIKRVHSLNNIEVKKNKSSFICLDCEQPFYQRLQLKAHLTKVHNIEFRSHSIEFSSLQDFYNLKTNMESQTKSMYIASSGFKTCKDGTKNKIYVCNRNGKYISTVKGSTRRRRIKQGGSLKQNFGCTSGLKVNIGADGQVQCTYCLKHYAHDELKLGNIKSEVDAKTLTHSSEYLADKPSSSKRLLRSSISPTDKIISSKRPLRSKRACSPDTFNEPLMFNFETVKPEVDIERHPSMNVHSSLSRQYYDNHVLGASKIKVLLALDELTKAIDTCQSASRLDKLSSNIIRIKTKLSNYRK